jgi:hypothetical protein
MAPTPTRVAQLLAELEAEMDHAKMLRKDADEKQLEREAEVKPFVPVLVHTHKRI